MPEEVAVPTGSAPVVPPPPPSEPIVDDPKVIPGEDPSVQKTEIPPTEVTTEEPEETEPDLEAVPETSGDFQKYKPLFKEHPELRAILGREKAYSELAPSFNEFREIAQRIPTLADAETLTNQAENYRQMGDTFRTDPVRFVEALKESDQLAFSNLARKLPELLAESDPEAYSVQARFYMNGAINVMFQEAQEEAQQSGDKNYLAAVSFISQKLGIRPGAQPQAATPNSELEKLRREKAEREQSDRQGQAQSFIENVDYEVRETLLADIEKIVQDTMPNLNDAQMKRIMNECWNKTIETVVAQPQTRAQFEIYKANARKGKTSEADKRAAIDFGTRRGKLAAQRATAAVLSEWSKTILTNQKQKIAKAQSVAAQTKDVGLGAQAGASATAPKPAPSNGKPRTASQIYEELANGRYQPRP